MYTLIMHLLCPRSNNWAAPGWQVQAATQWQSLVVQRINQDINCTQALRGVLSSLKTRPTWSQRELESPVCLWPHHRADREHHRVSNKVVFVWGWLMPCDLAQFPWSGWNELTCPRSQQGTEAAGLFQWVSLAGMTAQSTQLALYLWRFSFVCRFTASSSDE